jgi:hypothetical protein
MDQPVAFPDPDAAACQAATDCHNSCSLGIQEWITFLNIDHLPHKSGINM